jgi:drug/metabolite transporter (DMT)-like permease
MLLPVMMLDRFRSLHLPALRRQWFGLVCIGLFMVRSFYLAYKLLHRVSREAVTVSTARDVSI